MSKFNRIFDGKDYFECKNCGSLAVIDDDNKLMRMIMTEQGVPAIYEEKNTNEFIGPNNELRCNCMDQK